jgi:hypothetical protein
MQRAIVAKMIARAEAGSPLDRVSVPIFRSRHLEVAYRSHRRLSQTQHS